MPAKYGSIGVMKYESVTKRARNELLYNYYLAHRELSLKEFGVIFGVSKQRVSKIIKREKELAGVSRNYRSQENSCKEREINRASKQGVEMILLTDGEMQLAITSAISDWALSGYNEGWGDDAMAQDNYCVIRKAQLKKTLIGVGKESKRMDGTIYLVPDYVEYRKALKEVGLK